MKRLHFTFVALASVLFGLAISSCSKDETPPDAEGGMIEQLQAGCPMVVEGTGVTATDTEGGVALTFTTDTGDVADLRTRVQHMAQMYEMQHGQAGMMWHHMGGEGMGGGGPGMGGEGMVQMAGRGPMPAASTTKTDTDSGARIELRPTDPLQLDDLREHVRWHQQRLRSGECWMLQEQPTNTPRVEQE